VEKPVVVVAAQVEEVVVIQGALEVAGQAAAAVALQETVGLAVKAADLVLKVSAKEMKAKGLLQ
jgi:SspJ family small acid-soluble spore protein